MRGLQVGPDPTIDGGGPRLLAALALVALVALPVRAGVQDGPDSVDPTGALPQRIVTEAPADMHTSGFVVGGFCSDADTADCTRDCMTKMRQEGKRLSYVWCSYNYGSLPSPLQGPYRQPVCECGTPDLSIGTCPDPGKQGA